MRVAVKYLDRVVDINYYPTERAASNKRWRPVGLGLMGLQDVFFKMDLPFDSDEAKEISSRKVQEEIYYAALSTSVRAGGEEFGAHESFSETRAAEGVFQFDFWGVEPSEPERWNVLREKVMEQYGLA